MSQHSRLVLFSRPVSKLLLKGLSLFSELTTFLHGLVSASDREDSRFYERVKTRAVSQINYFHLYARMQDTSVQLTYCVVHSFLTWVVLSPKSCTALLLLLEVTTSFIFFFFFAFYFNFNCKLHTGSKDSTDHNLSHMNQTFTFFTYLSV